MSEKIYAWLLRLYPSHFRERYGEEALQLFRDRARDEKGFFPRLRLWLDLMADLAISVPREYYYFEPELLGASADQRLGGIPSFVVIEGGSPRPGALLSGGVLTMLVLATCSILLSRAGNFTPRRTFAASSQSRGYKNSSAFGGQASPTGTEGGNGTSPFGRSVVSGRELRAGETSNSQSEALPPNASESSQPQTPQPEDDGNAGIIHAAKGDAKVDAAERHRVIHGAVANLKRYYVYPEIAQKTSDALLAHEKNGDYDAVKDGGVFADLLTKQMRDASQDMHLDVVYSQDPLPEHPLGAIPGSLERYREFIEHSNCTFERFEILPHHIGYLKLNSFPDLSVCEATTRAEMYRVNDAAAIIFDLRENRGGDADMVMLLAAYLFDHPEYMYNPRENTTQQAWTRSPVPGNKLADKPVYILTSSLTSSAAEHFCYDLKMLKRGTLVGETTSGAAHSGVFHRIDEHFGMGIPETKPINPFSNSDWAVVGVEPDVTVKAGDALETAIKLAETQLRKK